MKVIDHLRQAQGPQISVEIIPPRRGGNVEDLYRAVESIMPYSPPYIDVTSHAADVIWEEMPDGSFKKRIKRKSPGTFGLCAALKYKFDIDPVPHLLCAGFTREETEDALIELNYLGVENVLLLRGDSKVKKPVREDRTMNPFALDLVQQVNDMNHGKYLGELIDAQSTNFCIGTACYPEKHFEAPSLNFDIQNLLRKQEAGAEYAVTQMFFDNQKFFRFVERAREAGVTIPIVPGLKIITSKDHMNRIPSIFFVDFPEELVEGMMNAPDAKSVSAIGIDWAYKQSSELLEAGYSNLHYYIMQNTKPFVELMDRLSITM
jgi:methylenetetrahydrofolate reductase (NADPH)